MYRLWCMKITPNAVCRRVGWRAFEAPHNCGNISSATTFHLQTLKRCHWPARRHSTCLRTSGTSRVVHVWPAGPASIVPALPARLSRRRQPRRRVPLPHRRALQWGPPQRQRPRMELLQQAQLSHNHVSGMAPIVCLMRLKHVYITMSPPSIMSPPRSHSAMPAAAPPAGTWAASAAPCGRPMAQSVVHGRCWSARAPLSCA